MFSSMGCPTLARPGDTTTPHRPCGVHTNVGLHQKPHALAEKDSPSFCFLKPGFSLLLLSHETWRHHRGCQTQMDAPRAQMGRRCPCPCFGSIGAILRPRGGNRALRSAGPFITICHWLGWVCATARAQRIGIPAWALHAQASEDVPGCRPKVTPSALPIPKHLSLKGLRGGRRFF